MEGTLTVTVTDPLKCEGSGIGEVGYITYRVNYTSDVPDFVGSGSVTRRYNDFCWLSEILNLTVSGCIIPSLPPKQTVGRFSADFVNGRRRGLEKFMQRLCLHPELRKSNFLKQFLEADENAFKEVMRISQNLKPNKIVSVTDTIKSKWNAYVVTGKHIELEKDASSIAVDEVLTYINKIEEVMNKLVESAALLTDRSRKSAQSLREFGQSFASYGIAEGSELGQMLYNLGSGIDGLSATAGDHASEEIEKLLEPLSEQARVLDSVKIAISIRAERRQQYVQELTQLDALQVSYNKVLGQPGKESTAADKAKQIEATQSKADAIKADFEHMTARLLKDFGDFQVRKCEEIQNILLAFVELQVRHHSESLEKWQEFKPFIEDSKPVTTQVPSKRDDLDSIFTDVASPDKSVVPANTTKTADTCQEGVLSAEPTEEDYDNLGEEDTVGI